MEEDFGFAADRGELTERDTKSTRSVTGSQVEVGLCFQVNNLYAISETDSQFSSELILNMTWVDPWLAQSIQDGSLKAQLEPAGLWDDFEAGWLFKDFQSAPLADQKNFRSARILNELLDNKPVPTWMNVIENKSSVADPVYLMDEKTGRVGYSLTVRSVFDEVMELSAFPFDDQFFDIRTYWEDSEKYTWRLAPHPREKNAWYGAWKTNKAKTKITEHPEWILGINLDDHMDTFASAGSDTVFPRYSMRIQASRRYSYFVINVFGVVFLQVALGIGIFLFEAIEFEARFTNILTLFLTIVAFRIVLTDKLPKVAYLTVADSYMLSAFAMYSFTAAASFTNYGMYKSHGNETRAEEIDDICFYIYLGGWALSHVLTALMVFWTRSSALSARTEDTGWVVLADGQKVTMDDDGKKKYEQYRPLKI